MKPLISILIPVYNAERYLERCLDSAISQTYSNIEVILVDDGSTDSSREICDQYAERDHRVKVFHKVNEGVAATRNYLLSKATGEYLMFVDSDDTIGKNTVSDMYARIVYDETDLVIGNYLSVHDESGEIYKYHDVLGDAILETEGILEYIGINDFMIWVPWGKLYRRELFHGISYPLLSVGEDAWLFPALLRKCKSVSTMKDYVYLYHIVLDSLTNKTSLRKQYDSMMGYIHMSKELCDMGSVSAAKKIYDRCIGAALGLGNYNNSWYLVKNSFSCDELRVLLRGRGIKPYLKWLCLYVPGVYRAIRWVKTRLGYE